MLKSALTDALSGTPASQQQQQAAGGSSASSIHLDPHVFPCLYCDLPETAWPGDASEYGPDDKQEGTTRAGTVPHSSSLADGTPAADYDLNPFRRRGGKESVPGSLAEVIGSLPKGMSVEERASVARLAPLSPTLAVLKEMGGSRVGDRNVEAKQLRRHVLRGTVIVFIAAGYSGKRFVFERAKELGVRSVIVDGPDSWSQALVGQGLAEKFVPLDFSDADGVFERCLSSIKKVRSALGGLDGIVTFCEMAVPLVSRLAEALNLPGNAPEAVDNARDKHAARSVLQKAGLPSPKHFLIAQPEHLSQAANHVGFPAVIKPIHGAASIGVVRVDDMASLQLEYAKVIQQLKRAVIIAGALQEGGDDDPEEGNAGSWICLDIMMEEYLDGPEVDCDLVFSGGRVVYGCITDNWPTFEPYFLETGSNCPSTLPRQQQAELLQLSVDSCKALGMTWGVFHVEGKYTSRGPRLIEVNCRMGGGPVRATNLLVWGVDLVEEALLAGAGIPSQPPASREPLKCLAEYSINAPSTGMLRSLEPIERFQQSEDVHYVNALCEPGSKVVSATDGLPTWIVELMVFKPNVQEAIDYIKTLVAACEAEIVIDPQ